MNNERTTAERITQMVSLLILFSILGVAFWANMRVEDDHPLIVAQAHLDQVRETPYGYYVPVTITNTGGRTAQDVVVVGELDLGNGVTEEGQVTIAFLAGGEREQGEIIFQTDPGRGDLSVHATSYMVP